MDNKNEFKFLNGQILVYCGGLIFNHSSVNNNVLTLMEVCMRKILLTALLALSPVAFAGPECTTADKAEWQDKDQFQENLKAQGYDIKKFKVTEGNCYEIYGWNKDKQKVEIYYNPVTGAVVKEEIED